MKMHPSWLGLLAPATDNDTALPMGGGYPGPRRVRACRKPDGSVAGVDEYGQEVEILGGDEILGGGEDFGDEFSGDEDEDDDLLDGDEDEDILGDDSASGDDFLGAVAQVERKVAAIDRRIDSHERKLEKAQEGKGLFPAKRAAQHKRQIRKLKAKRAKLMASIKKGHAKRRMGYHEAGRGFSGGGYAVTGAPPGPGRLVRYPMYSGTITSASTPRSSTTTGAAGILATSDDSLSTEVMSWVQYRVLGFTAQVIQASSGCVALVKNLNLGGGNNLFTHTAYADASVYDTDKESLVGLRANPDVSAPNAMNVSANARGGVTSDAVVMTCQIVGDLLRDDGTSGSSRLVGRGNPGPYG